MRLKNPMITVIIPAYCCEAYIGETLASVLAQTYSNIEVLVIDDRSPDNTAAIVRKVAARDERVVFLQNEENLGVARTRNRGLDQATSEYIAFLDADDLWMPEKLERQIQHMHNAKLELCYTGYAFINEVGKSIGRPYSVPDTVTFEGLLRENCIGCSTVLLRHDVLKGIRMRTEYSHEDYVFWLELYRKGLTLGGISDPLTLYRIHSANRSANKAAAARERWKIYRNYLGMSMLTSANYFAHYAIASLQKRW